MHKASKFSDVVTEQAIFAKSAPQNKKQLRKRVPPFNEKEWKDHVPGILLPGLLVKLSQNWDWGTLLLSMGNKTTLRQVTAQALRFLHYSLNS